jgi:DNA-binding response OmpR family regulator
MKVLLVEDSVRLSRSIATYLRRFGYAVDPSENGADGLRLARAGGYDAIVLDIMLPGMDGLSVLGRLRDAGCVAPVLLLTAKDSVSDRVRGLDLGADDYLIKPFALEELVARIRALCRRRHGQRAACLSAGHLRLDPAARVAYRDGVPLSLTPREYCVLEYLMMRRGRVLSRREIEDHIYELSDEPASNVVDSTVCSLRKKISAPGKPPLIHTRRGVGYLFSEDLS